jgi:dolichol-phosphate mannosyltransferase
MNALQVSVVVPTYHEVENLRELTTRVFRSLYAAGWLAELIIVDDNSRDGTVELCEELSQSYPLRLITRTDERGLATAVIRGIEEAVGKFLVVMDADLSHPPETVPDLLQAIATGGADFAIGSRYVNGGSIDESWTWFRLLNSRLATLLAAGLTNARDPMAGFFALRRTTAGDTADLNPCGYKIGLEILVRRNCQSVAEVPIHFNDRQHGESKLNLREQWLYIQHLLRLYAFRYSELVRFSAFGLVGLSGMLIDLVSFAALLPVVGTAIGRAVAIWIAMSWNFLLNRRFTFRAARSAKPVVEYVRFCTACLLGAGVSWTTSVTLISASEFFRARPIGAAVVGTALAAVFNYVMCRSWVFGKPDKPAVDVTAAEADVRSAA